MSGVKGRSGKRKLPSTIIEEALNRVKTEELPKLLQVLIDKAVGGDRDSAIYLLDRVLGRPAASISMDAKVKAITFSADDYQACITTVQQEEQQLLAAPVETPLTE